MAQPIISFCIPTLNFGSYIGATLRSILEQADDRVQIVIVDGGSTDDTAAVVAEAMARFPQIKFVRREKRYGLDRDILETVVQADGEYCWLLGSDDLLVPGAVVRAMTAIETGGWDVFLMGVKICNRSLQPLHDHPILDCSQPQTFDWSVPSERADYFRRARTSTAFFSYISDVLVHRKRWLAGPSVEQFIGCYWIIAAKVLAISQSGLRVRFDPATYILKRLGNDAFAALGPMWRFALSMRGFRDLACHFLGGDSPEAREVSRCVANEYPFADVLEYKRLVMPSADRKARREFYDLVRRNYARGGKLNSIRYLLVRFTPVWVLSIARPPYRFVRNLIKPQ